MALNAGNFTMTSVKFNTVVVYRGTLLNTAIYRGILFFVVPSPTTKGTLQKRSAKDFCDDVVM